MLVRLHNSGDASLNPTGALHLSLSAEDLAELAALTATSDQTFDFLDETPPSASPSTSPRARAAPTRRPKKITPETEKTPEWRAKRAKNTERARLSRQHRQAAEQAEAAHLAGLQHRHAQLTLELEALTAFRSRVLALLALET